MIDIFCNNHLKDRTFDEHYFLWKKALSELRLTRSERLQLSSLILDSSCMNKRLDILDIHKLLSLNWKICTKKSVQICLQYAFKENYIYINNTGYLLFDSYKTHYKQVQTQLHVPKPLKLPERKEFVSIPNNNVYETSTLKELHLLTQSYLNAWKYLVNLK